jgi:hypothetical protein
MGFTIGSSSAQNEPPLLSNNKVWDEKRTMIENALNSACAPFCVKDARKQISANAAVPASTGLSGARGNKSEHVKQRSQEHETGLFHKISFFVNSLISDQPKAEHKPVDQFNQEITNLNNALQSSDNKSIQECLNKLTLALNKHCNKTSLSVNEKSLAAKAVVDTILKLHSTLMAKNPQAANEFMQQFSKNIKISRQEHTIQALLNSERFDANNVDPKSAKNILDAAMENLVRSFWGVSPRMLSSLKDLAKSSQLDRPTIETHIGTAIAGSEFDLADAVIELNNGKIPNIDSVINRTIEERSLTLAMLIVKHDQNSLQTLINKCVDGNLEVFLNDIINATGHTLTSEQISQISHQTHVQGNLSFMKALYPNSWKENAAALFKMIPDEAKSDKLTQYFLNSDIADVKEFSTLLRKQGSITEDQFRRASEFQDNGGRLIARFPSPADQKAMHAEYGQKFANYEQQQLAYGNKRFEVVNQTLAEIRGDKSKSLESVYIQLKGGKPSEDPFWRDYGADTPIGERYAKFKSLAHEKLVQGRDGQKPDVLLRRGNETQITFTTADKKTVELTSFGPAARTASPHLSFFHTNPLGSQDDPRWLDQLGISQDWKELITTTVDVKNPDSVKDFQNKVAAFYWKGVQLMPTDRGNSQTMLELHYILYRLHDLQPPAPSREALLPDCIALCSTMGEFVNRYSSCWDLG